MEQSYNLRPLWDSILEVYQEIVKICERHNLRHWVAYGTALGAMRHQGFIPWDDDFDIYMPRPDYECFIKYAQGELPKDYEWKSIEVDPDYKLIFGKVRLANNKKVASVQADARLNLSQGIFVDVFPMDGLPATKLGRYIWALQRSWKRHRGIGLKDLQDWLSKRSFDQSEVVCYAMDDYNKGRIARKRSWYDETKFVPFENIIVPVPIGVELDLEQQYGDWRLLPPVEARAPSHSVL